VEKKKVASFYTGQCNIVNCIPILISPYVNNLARNPQEQHMGYEWIIFLYTHLDCLSLPRNFFPSNGHLSFHVFLSLFHG